jgi:hypothetical protein
MFLRICTLPKEFIEQQLQVDEYYVEGSYPNTEFYIDITSLDIKIIPQKPDEYHVFNSITKDWDYSEPLLRADVINKRNNLLFSSDWTDTVSASTRLENYNAWQFYRQQLRDITKQEGYPFNVIWPTQPV